MTQKVTNKLTLYFQKKDLEALKVRRENITELVREILIDIVPTLDVTEELDDSEVRVRSYKRIKRGNGRSYLQVTVPVYIKDLLREQAKLRKKSMSQIVKEILYSHINDEKYKNI